MGPERRLPPAIHNSLVRASALSPRTFTMVCVTVECEPRNGVTTGCSSPFDAEETGLLACVAVLRSTCSHAPLPAHKSSRRDARACTVATPEGHCALFWMARVQTVVSYRRARNHVDSSEPVGSRSLVDPSSHVEIRLS
eukprot:1573226-Pleurochrysis_carterae.AAC.1